MSASKAAGISRPIDFESVVTGKERQRRLVIAHLDGERGAVGGRHVGRIGDDDFEALAGDGREQIAFEKAKEDTVALGVFLGDSERRAGEIDGGDHSNYRRRRERN